MTRDEALVASMKRMGWHPNTHFDPELVRRVMWRIGLSRVNRIACIDAATPRGKLPELNLLQGTDLCVHAACGWLLKRNNFWDTWYDCHPAHVYLTPDVYLGLQFAVLRGTEGALQFLSEQTGSPVH